jgi:hypothetical protein
MRKLTEQELKDLKAWEKHQSYMKAYNKRGYVRAKRTRYNKARWARIKAAKDLLDDEELPEDQELSEEELTIEEQEEREQGESS